MQAGFETMLGYKNVIISHPNLNKSVMACCDGSGVVQTKCLLSLNAELPALVI